MTYCVRNFRTKKALKEAVSNGENVEIEPDAFNRIKSGKFYLEGPHYPEPHTWYAQAIVESGRVVKVVR